MALAQILVRIDEETGAFENALVAIFEAAEHYLGRNGSGAVRLDSVLGGVGVELANSSRLDPRSAKLVAQMSEQVEEALIRLLANRSVGDEEFREAMRAAPNILDVSQVRRVARAAGRPERVHLQGWMLGVGDSTWTRAVSAEASGPVFEAFMDDPDISAKHKRWGVLARLEAGRTLEVAWEIARDGVAFALDEGLDAESVLAAMPSERRRLLEYLLSHDDRAVRMIAVQAVACIGGMKADAAARKTPRR